MADVLTKTGQIAINVLATAISLAVFLIGQMSVRFPNFTAVLATLIGVYVCYKMIRRIIRFWVSLFVSLLKLIMLLAVLLLCLAVYLRGFRFFSVDIPHIKLYLATFSWDLLFHNDFRYSEFESTFELDPEFVNHFRENADDYFRKGYQVVNQYAPEIQNILHNF